MINELSDRYYSQDEATKLILDGENMFLTGKAGTGKSFLIKKIMRELVPEGALVISAPTGIAALNVGGVTCHRLFNLPIGLPTEVDYNFISGKLRELFYKNSSVRCIVIDELPMLRADYFDLINFKLQQIRGNQQLFGGLQVLAVGDFFQLEPIVSKNERKHFYDRYNSAFCFSSMGWNLPKVELGKIYRQTDTSQMALLNSIREKDKYWKVAIKRLNEITKPYDPDDKKTLHVCCYKSDASSINYMRYLEVKDTELKYRAEFNGRWNDSPVDHEISLKVGCQVLLCANCPEGNYVNGDRGTIIDLHKESVTVQLLNDEVVDVVHFTWERHAYNMNGSTLSKEVESRFRQIPIRLGWALVIHKIQGMTLDDVALHTGRGCFSNGQLYTGISRIKDLTNMSLVNKITKSDLLVSKEVKDYYLNN